MQNNNKKTDEILVLKRWRQTDPRVLLKKGCDVRDGKLLMAATAMVENYSTAAVPFSFQCKKDGEGFVTHRCWYPVTKKEVGVLKKCKDPYGNPYLKFAWVPVEKFHREGITGEGLQEIVLSEDQKLEQKGFAPADLEGPDVDPGKPVDLGEQKAEDLSGPVKVEGEPDQAPEEVTEAQAAAADEEQDELEKAIAEPTGVDAERKDLESKTIAELKGIVKDIGMETGKNPKKEELIEMILG